MRVIICAKCARKMEKVRSGVIVAELFRDDKHIYKLWRADQFDCTACGFTVISDFADAPFARYPDTEDSEDVLAEIGKAKIKGQYYRWPEKGGG